MPQTEDNSVIWPECMLMHLCRRKCKAKASELGAAEREDPKVILVPFGGCVRFERRREEGE